MTTTDPKRHYPVLIVVPLLAALLGVAGPSRGAAAAPVVPAQDLIEYALMARFVASAATYQDGGSVTVSLGADQVARLQAACGLAGVPGPVHLTLTWDRSQVTRLAIGRGDRSALCALVAPTAGGAAGSSPATPSTQRPMRVFGGFRAV